MKTIFLLAALPGPNKTGLPQIGAGQSNLSNALAVFFGVVAALAVLSIMIAAFNFVTGGGDPEKISRSKNTIFLSIIGLVIALSAELIVLTVLNRL